MVLKQADNLYFVLKNGTNLKNYLYNLLLLSNNILLFYNRDKYISARGRRISRTSQNFSYTVREMWCRENTAL